MIQVLCRLKLIATPTYVAASHTLNEIIDNASYPIEAGESVTGWVGGNKFRAYSYCEILSICGLCALVAVKWCTCRTNMALACIGRPSEDGKGSIWSGIIVEPPNLPLLSLSQVLRQHQSMWSVAGCSQADRPVEL